MIAWMFFLLAIAAALAAAAWIAEKAAQRSAIPIRGIWAATLVGSFVLPAAIPYTKSNPPTIEAAHPAHDGPGREPIHVAALTSRLWPSAGTPVIAVEYDRYILIAWATTSTVLLMGIVLCSAAWHRRRRTWTRGTIDSISVYFAPDTGPLVIGVIRPRIVVPSWLQASPSAQRTLVVAHETEHIRALDPQLLTLALILVALMPWNVALWWQLRRLRRGMEIDCDARVLAAGHDALSYGETLLSVSHRQSRSLTPVTAMSGSHSLLEQRIAIMVKPPVQYRRTVTLGMAGLAFTVLAAATQVAPPPALELKASSLQTLAGHYRYADNAVLVITRAHDHLLARFSGQSAADDIYPESPTRFVYRDRAARIEFQTDAQGQATSAALIQNGARTAMPRIAATDAAKIEAQRSARLERQIASPGSEVALRHLIEGIQSGHPDLHRLNPQLAGAIGKDWPEFQKRLAPLGPVTALEFKAIDANGFDAYEAIHAHGRSEWAIGIDSNGIITGATAPIEHPAE